MSAYEALAHWYDQLTEDVDYAGWADWLERHFRRQSAGVPGAGSGLRHRQPVLRTGPPGLWRGGGTCRRRC